MLAGLVLTSALIGLLATGFAVAASAPLWAAMALYPLVCSLCLLMLAAIGSMRTGDAPRAPALARQQA